MAILQASDFKKIRTPEDFLKKIEQLYGRERRDLSKHLGNPPDVRNVPAKVWKQIREDEEALMLALLVGFGSMMLDDWMDSIEVFTEEDVPRERIRRRFMSTARKRSRAVASSVTRTTKKRLRSALDTEERVSKRRTLDEILGTARAETVTRTELSAARGAAAMAAYEGAKSLGLDVHAVWTLRPCDHCKVCPNLHRTDYPFWSQYAAHPPAHVNCCCVIELEYGDRDDLLSRGVIREGDHSAVIDAKVDERMPYFEPRL